MYEQGTALANRLRYISIVVSMCFGLLVLSTICTVYVGTVVYQNRELVNRTITSVLEVTENLGWTVSNMRNFLEGNVMAVICASEKIRSYIGPLCPSESFASTGDAPRAGLQKRGAVMTRAEAKALAEELAAAFLELSESLG